MSVAAATGEAKTSHRAQAIELFRKAEWRAALKYLDYALDESPADTHLLNLRARAFEALGQFEEALRSVDRCLEHDPRNVADLRNRGLVLTKLRRPADALASFDAVLALEPNHADVLLKRAYLLHQLDRREDALASAERAVSIAPSDPHALNTRGMILETFCRYDDALADFERVLAIDPQFADAINNRGMIYARNGQFEDALTCYERSLALAPDQPQALYNRAMVRLALGDWSRGFREFESRWNIAPLEAARFTRLAPVWLGEEDISGKTVLLHHEQGYGDSLQFVRYVPLVERMGAKVILAVPAGLRALMRTLPGNPQVVSEGDPVPQHDFCCPLMSLPMVFGTTPDNAPAEIPYLSASPERVMTWSRRLGAARQARIGLVWSGRRYPPINHPRDMTLEMLQPLLTLPADFVCLQTEMTEEDRILLDATPQIACFAAELKDFADTAALIENLDLVISVDTAVSHLAGALGKPVWLLNRYASCWRWLQSRTDSPWYPTLRVFRQPSVGDWGGVVRNVQSAAAEFIALYQRPSGRAQVKSMPSEADRHEAVAQSLRLALSEHKEGRIEGAIGAYQHVLSLDPQQPEALHYLGVALAQTGRCQEALSPLAKLLQAQPGNSAAHNHYGNALAGLFRFEEALASYERAIALSPRFDDAYYNRGVALDRLDRREAALASYEQALALNPAYAAAYNNRGNVLLDLGRREEALVSYERATTLRPEYVDAWVNRANLLRMFHRYDQALLCSQRALEGNPLQAEVHSSRGAILANMGRYDEALASYQRAVALNPQLADGLWNKAILHLSRGEFREGWHLYEARWRVKSLGLTHRCESRPPWLGKESLQGKVILLHAEQGYGDTIQFCRYAPLVASMGARVILGVPAALKTLMESLEGIEQVIAQGPLPPYDHHCPLLSLPYATSTDLESILAPAKYLSADPVARERWAQRLSDHGAPRIGLVWAGKPSHSNDLNRSIALQTLLPLVRPDFQWVSLQKEIRHSDRSVLPRLPHLLLAGEELGDFSDSASLIAELDLVITVDTAIAHLAGALGKPVWILLPKVADWRWLQDRDNSPWYPSARLFRQSDAGNWSEVVQRVAIELDAFMANYKARRGSL